MHNHTAACYAEQPVYERQLVCAIPEHIHSDACYGTRRILTCGKNEIEPHTHTISCYENGPNGESPEEMGWVTIDASGRLTGDPSHLNCGKQEILPHVHGPECFAWKAAEYPADPAAEENAVTDRDTVIEPADEEPDYADFTTEVPVEGAGYTLTVRGGSDCGIPEDAVFTAAALDEENAAYAAYHDQAIKAVADGQKTVLGLFDLTITGADGEKIQPAAPVSVPYASRNRFRQRENLVHQSVWRKKRSSFCRMA